MNLTNFRFETDADGIALAHLGHARPLDERHHPRGDGASSTGSSTQSSRDPAIKGCVITSGKDTFSGGADLSMLQRARREYAKARKEQGEEAAMQLFFEDSRRLSLLYRKLETCGKPFAVAINGVCLGGAFELALACHYRVLSDDDKTRVGLPEIKVGLFPGAGGTQRVARLMQTGDACRCCSRASRSSRAHSARPPSLVHEVAPRARDRRARAQAWIVDGGKAQAPWDAKDFKPPSGKVFSPGGMMIWPAANAIYRRETYDNYPAAKAILHAVYEGLQLPMDLGADASRRAGSRRFCARRKRRR